MAKPPRHRSDFHFRLKPHQQVKMTGYGEDLRQKWTAIGQELIDHSRLLDFPYDWLIHVPPERLLGGSPIQDYQKLLSVYLEDAIASLTRLPRLLPYAGPYAPQQSWALNAAVRESRRCCHLAFMLLAQILDPSDPPPASN